MDASLNAEKNWLQQVVSSIIPMRRLFLIINLGFYQELVCSGMCILWIIVRMLKHWFLQVVSSIIPMRRLFLIINLGFYQEIVCSGMCILWIIVRMLKNWFLQVGGSIIPMRRLFLIINLDFYQEIVCSGMCSGHPFVAAVWLCGGLHTFATKHNAVNFSGFCHEECASLSWV